MTEFLKLRDAERAVPRLEISIFNREHNTAYKQGMLEREQSMKANREREVDEETNFLGPYLAKLGFPLYLTETQAVRVRDQCLDDFKRLLVKRANDVQQQFEKVCVRSMMDFPMDDVIMCFRFEVWEGVGREGQVVSGQFG